MSNVECDRCKKIITSIEDINTIFNYELKRLIVCNECKEIIKKLKI